MLHLARHRSPDRSPNDLNNINGLNHYIGMKAIVPERDSRAPVMPLDRRRAHRDRAAGRRWSAAAPALRLDRGLRARRRWPGWPTSGGGGTTTATTSIPHAIIKVPGMTYQPPLIGRSSCSTSRDLVARPGGWIAILAVGAVVTVAVLEWRLCEVARAPAATVPRLSVVAWTRCAPRRPGAASGGRARWVASRSRSRWPPWQRTPRRRRAESWSRRKGSSLR